VHAQPDLFVKKTVAVKKWDFIALHVKTLNVTALIPFM
jgi:hypothetical protein